MAVPSGEAKMSDIRTEWGRSGAIKMSEMYRGGTYVKAKASDNTATNLAASVPTSGEVSIDDFRGTGKAFATPTHQVLPIKVLLPCLVMTMMWTTQKRLSSIVALN